MKFKFLLVGVVMAVLMAGVVCATVCTTTSCSTDWNTGAGEGWVKTSGSNPAFASGYYTSADTGYSAINMNFTPAITTSLLNTSGFNITGTFYFTELGYGVVGIDKKVPTADWGEQYWLWYFSNSGTGNGTLNFGNGVTSSGLATNPYKCGIVKELKPETNQWYSYEWLRYPNKTQVFTIKNSTTTNVVCVVYNASDSELLRWNPLINTSTFMVQRNIMRFDNYSIQTLSLDYPVPVVTNLSVTSSSNLNVFGYPTRYNLGLYDRSPTVVVTLNSAAMGVRMDTTDANYSLMGGVACAGATTSWTCVWNQTLPLGNNTFYFGMTTASNSSTTPAPNTSMANVYVPYAFNATFVSQSPADLNALNSVSIGLNATYTIIEQNVTSPVINYTIGSSTRTNTFILNGTSLTGYSTKTYSSNTANTSYMFWLQDNSILPAIYNKNPTLDENTTHTVYSCASASCGVKVEGLNFSNSSSKIFEYMANGTTSQPINTYYCNNTATGTVTSSTSCTLVCSIPANQAYNHCHVGNTGTINACHQVCTIPYNQSNNRVNNAIGLTQTGFMVLIAPPTGANFYQVGTSARTTETATTTNKGGAWNAQTWHLDSHWHEFDGTDYLKYGACGWNYDNTAYNCSTQRTDLLETGGLPPSAPQITSPLEGSYKGTITTSWTSSISPNSYPIVNYNLSLYYANGTITKLHNSTNLSYSWNTASIVDAENYSLRVCAFDNNSLSACGFSGLLFIDNTAPGLNGNTTDPASPATYSNSATYVLGDNATDAGVGVDKVVLHFNGVDYVSTNTSNPYTVTLPIVLAVGTYSYNWTVNDTLGNLNTSVVRSYVVSKAASSETLMLDGVAANVTVSTPATVNITATLTAGSSLVAVFKNGTLIANGTSTSNVTSFPNVGVFNITAQYFATQNFSASSTTHYVIAQDTTPPTVTLNSPADGLLTNNPVFNFNWTASDETATTLNCSLTVDVTSYAWQTSTSGMAQNRSITFTSGTDGLHSWSVGCTDQYNSIPSVTRTFTLDTLPPNIGNVTFTPYSGATYSNTTAPVVTMDAYDANNISTITLYFNGAAITPTHTTGNTYTATLPVLAAGVYQYNITANDTSNNRNTTTSIQNSWTGTVSRHYSNPSTEANASITVIPPDTKMYVLAQNNGEYHSYTYVYANVSITFNSIPSSSFSFDVTKDYSYAEACTYQVSQTYSKIISIGNQSLTLGTASSPLNWTGAWTGTYAAGAWTIKQDGTTRGVINVTGNVSIKINSYLHTYDCSDDYANATVNLTLQNIQYDLLGNTSYTVNKATPTMSFDVEPNPALIIEPVTLNCSITPISDGPNALAVSINGALNVAGTDRIDHPYTPFAAGSYSFLCNTTATQNYSSTNSIITFVSSNNSIIQLKNSYDNTTLQTWNVTVNGVNYGTGLAGTSITLPLAYSTYNMTFSTTCTGDSSANCGFITNNQEINTATTTTASVNQTLITIRMINTNTGLPITGTTFTINKPTGGTTTTTTGTYTISPHPTTTYQFNITAPAFTTKYFNLTIPNAFTISNTDINYSLGTDTSYAIDNCSHLTTQAVNISILYENSSLPVSGATLAGYFSVYINNIAEYRDFNLTWPTGAYKAICINTTIQPLLTNAQIEFGASGYNTQTYYFTGTNLTNNTQYLQLYLAQSATPITLTVINQYSQPVTNAQIQIFAYDLSTNTYHNSQIVKTGSDGTTIAYLTPYTVWYKFAIYTSDGVLRLSQDGQDPIKIQTTTHTFVINTGTNTNIFGQIQQIGTISCLINYTNATHNFRFDWNDPTGTSTNGCLNVYRRTSMGDVLVNTSCASGSGGSILLNIGNNTGTNEYSATSSIAWQGNAIPCGNPITYSYDFTWQMYGLQGLLLSFLFLLTLVMLGIYSPVASVFLLMIGLLAVDLLQIWHISWPALVVIEIALGIVLYKMQQK